jgi:hypothetical protein
MQPGFNLFWHSILTVNWPIRKITSTKSYSKKKQLSTVSRWQQTSTIKHLIPVDEINQSLYKIFLQLMHCSVLALSQQLHQIQVFERINIINTSLTL